jgi:Zn-dependent peptidase ImmA (M78 family)/transcriptional regulator with XRE-family HTH domain
MSSENRRGPEFNPHRLRLARERRALTKEALAGLCGVSRRAVSDWEAGRVENPPVEQIAVVLDFPEAFFYMEDLDEVRLDAVSFRALTSMSQRQINRVLANASMIRAFADWIDERYRTPLTDIPSIEELTASQHANEPSPVDSAGAMRNIWSLGKKPIPDMLALLESRGVRVFGLGIEDREVDAFSLWHGRHAYIFLNVSKSSERLRFDLAHELGHLCMHRGIRTNRSRQYELDANTFASNFLMPKAGLLPQISGPPRLNDVFVLKKSWRVSVTAMVRRLHQLGRISDWQYRTWMIDLSERGFRTSEPDGIDRERSSLLRQVMTLSREDGWSLDRISRELGVPRSDLSSALMGLTVTPVLSL